MIQYYILDDETRVVLEEIPGVLGSDYINASWINVRDNETLNLYFPSKFYNFSGFQISQCLHSSSRYCLTLNEAVKKWFVNTGCFVLCRAQEDYSW